MKIINFKKLLALLFVFVLILQNPISNFRLSRSRSRSRSRSKSRSKLKTNTKTGFIIASALSFYNVCKKMLGGGTTCEKSKALLAQEKTDREFTIKTETLLKMIRSNELIEEKPLILEHISQFIGMIPVEYFESHEDFIINYVNCFIEKKNLNHGPAHTDESLKKFKSRISVLFDNQNRIKHGLKILTFFEYNDQLAKHFLEHIFTEFTSCSNSNLVNFLNTQNEDKKNKFTKALNLIKNPPKSVKRKLKKRLNSEEKFAKTDEGEEFDQKVLELAKKMDIANYYANKVKDVSQTIIDATESIKEVIDVIQKPHEHFKEVKDTLIAFNLKEVVKELEKLQEDIKKFGKDHEKHIKKFVEIEKKYLPYVKKVNEISGKVFDITEKSSKILKEISTLSLSDRPSISIAKILLISSSVLDIIPAKIPQKEFISKALKKTSEVIQNSERLQEVIDTGIEHQSKNIEEATKYGFLPQISITFDDFAIDTDIRLEQHREAFERVVEQTLGPKTQEFFEQAEEGNIHEYSRNVYDFADGDVDPRLEQHRKEVVEFSKTVIDDHGKEYLRAFHGMNDFSVGDEMNSYSRSNSNSSTSFGRQDSMKSSTNSIGRQDSMKSSTSSIGRQDSMKSTGSKSNYSRQNSYSSMIDAADMFNPFNRR